MGKLSHSIHLQTQKQHSLIFSTLWEHLLLKIVWQVLTVPFLHRDSSVVWNFLSCLLIHLQGDILFLHMGLASEVHGHLKRDGVPIDHMTAKILLEQVQALWKVKNDNISDDRLEEPKQGSRSQAN